MNVLDMVLAASTAALVLLGLLRGMVRIVIALAAMVLAFLVASRFHQPLADHWSASGASTGILGMVSYLTLFLGVLLAGAVVGWLARALLAAAMLGWADRLAGAALGLVAAMLAGALLVLPLVAYLPGGGGAVERSRLAPYATAIADWVNVFAPDGLAHRYQQGVRILRRQWRAKDEAARGALDGGGRG